MLRQKIAMFCDGFHKRAALIYPSVIAILVLAFCQTQAQEPSAQIKPHIPNGWTELPKWAEQGLPFDTKSYYAIDEAENRESPYLEAFLEFSYADGSLFFPGIELADDFQAKLNADKVRKDKVYELLTQSGDRSGNRVNQIGPEYRQQAEEILALYQTAFEKLETAQKRSNCFFHNQFDTDSIAPHQIIAPGVARLLALRCLVETESGRAVRNVRMGLQLNRDLQRLSDSFGQMRSFFVEEVCFDKLVRQILARENLSIAQLNALIEVLVQHYSEQKQLEPNVEAGRYEYLMFRNLMRQLENGDYAASVDERCKDYGLKGSMPVPGLIIVELTERSNYETNSTVIEDEIAELAKNDPKIADLAENFAAANQEMEKERSELEKFNDDDRSEEVVLAPFLLKALVSMTAEDYKNEIVVLDKRYRQIESACALPFPHSTTELEILAHRWTTDDSWKNTKILKWFQPKSYLPSTRRKNTLRRNAYLCLAVAIKWQGEHENKTPENLAEALGGVGITGVPVDPYSGNPLKMSVVKNRVVVYSVGPDGDDDQAEKGFNLFGNPPSDPKKNPDGDVVIEVDYAIGN